MNQVQVVLTKTGNIVMTDEYTATSRPYLPYCDIEHHRFISELIPHYNYEYLFQGYDNDTIFNKNSIAQKFISSNILMK